MKRILLISIIVAALGGVLIFAFLEMRKEVAMEMQGEAPVLPESHVRRTASGEIVISLDAETQKRISLATAPVVATNFIQEHHGSARVLDPGPLTALMADISLAQVEWEASSNELKRARTLFAQDQNVSARALEAAESANRRNDITLKSARTKLMATFGKAIAERRDLQTLVSSLAAFESALVRVELPAGTQLSAAPSLVRLMPPNDSAAAIEAEFIGPAPSVSPETQGQAFLFLAKSPGLAPGQSLTARIPVSREGRAGVLVPAAAVLRADSRAWAYVQSDETNFVRRAVAVDCPLNGGWFVTNGIAAGEHVVIAGAQTLLSEEFKASIPVLAD